MMRTFGVRRIARGALGRLTVPVSLIWRCQDTATPVKAAMRASHRYGWPLQIIEGAADDPVLGQPEATARPIRSAILNAPDSPANPDNPRRNR
jgi:hypothetical protein